MLTYSLYDNHFTEDDPNDRLARPVDVTINTREDLIEEITGPGSILKPTETDAVIDNYWQTIANYIRKGEAYSDDYIRTRFGVSGVFQNEEDEFDPTRHKVLISVLPKDVITEAAADITLRKVDGRAIIPEIDGVYDWGSETNDDLLTPGDVLEITGTNLKIHNNLEDEGVFFVNQSDDTEEAADQIRTNEPKTLTLRIPEGLAAGTYRIEVRNTRHNGDTLRTGIFTPKLTVES
jgi:hypothetical protein